MWSLPTISVRNGPSVSFETNFLYIRNYLFTYFEINLRWEVKILTKKFLKNVKKNFFFFFLTILFIFMKVLFTIMH